MSRNIFGIRLVCAMAACVAFAAPAAAQSERPTGGPFTGLFKGSPERSAAHARPAWLSVRRVGRQSFGADAGWRHWRRRRERLRSAFHQTGSRERISGRRVLRLSQERHAEQFQRRGNAALFRSLPARLAEIHSGFIAISLTPV